MSHRIVNKKKVTIANGTCESEPVHLDHFIYGALHLPSAWTAAEIAFKACPTEDGTYNPLIDTDGARVLCTSTGPSRVHVLPTEVRNVRYIKLHSVDGSLADADQGAKREIYLDLKS